MKFNTIAIAALLTISESQAFKLSSVNEHACDFLDEHGEDLPTSLLDNEDVKPIELTMV